MNEKRLNSFTNVIVDYSMKIKPGEKVIINSTTNAIPLIKSLYKKCLEIGALPMINISLDEIEEIGYKYGSDEFLNYISSIDKAIAEKVDCSVNILSPYNTRGLSNISENRISIKQNANKQLREIKKQRESLGRFRWLITAYSCIASAIEAKMSISEYEDYISEALKLDCEDSVKAWQKTWDSQMEIIDYLKDKDTIHIKSRNADLKLRVKGRQWVNSCGNGNMPDGEIYTSPLEDSAEGWINYSYDGLIFGGKEFCNIRFEYKEGRVEKAYAEKGNDIIQQVLRMDESMRYIGEFAFGTNYGIKKFINNGLFDEKRGGTIHIANGDTLEGTDGKNRGPMHWDNITETNDVEIYADGELFYENGLFLVGNLNTTE